MHLHSFQDIKQKVDKYVKFSQGQVVERMTILPYTGEAMNKGLITQKPWIRRAIAQFSRYKVDTSQVSQRLPGTGRGGVDDSTVPQRGQE